MTMTRPMLTAIERSAQTTVPAMSKVPQHGGLLGGMRFLDLTASPPLDLVDVADWMEEYLVAPGYMSRPLRLLEPNERSVALWPRESTPRINEDLRALVDAARLRVITELQGFVGRPSDDRFLRQAIFLGRVRRERGQWVARPEVAAPLSGLVLSLFAVAILTDRALYEQELCVCDFCGRVSLDARPMMRAACAGHKPRSISGFTAKTPHATSGSHGFGF